MPSAREGPTLSAFEHQGVGGVHPISSFCGWCAPPSNGQPPSPSRDAPLPFQLAGKGAVSDHIESSSLECIYTDEIKHLRIGVYWFENFCANAGHNPISKWKGLVQTHLRSSPKGPFNREGRLQAGMSPAYWEN